MQFRCPNCHHPIEIADSGGKRTLADITCPSCNSRFDLSDDITETIVSVQGRRIAHFELREVLGEGSFGTVYKAWDSELDRAVALKVPRQGRISPETSQQFVREARAAAAITHPHVVAVHEVGRHDGAFYIACELINGVSLASYLKANRLEPREAAFLLIKLLRASQVFHDKGIIHRDLKPGNILLDENREPHIADFGLARREMSNDITVTQSGRIIGTPAYMPPEQARGESRSISNRSDIYSLGVILYELLTGQKPFTATDSRTLLFRILTDEPIPPCKLRRQIGRDLETICLKAMAKIPADRYTSADDMADDLQNFLDGKPISARPISRLRKIAKWTRRNKMLTAAAMAILAATAVTSQQMFFARWVDGPPRVTQLVRIRAEIDLADAAGLGPADWAFARLNDQRHPIADEIVYAKGQQDVNVILPPGEYLVVASLAGRGFHEVYRTVPEDRKSAPSSLTPKQFTWEGDAVRWPPVRIVADAVAVDGMALIKGGQYKTGVTGNPFSPPTTFVVDDFRIERNEVTFADFTQVLPAPASYSVDETLLRGTSPIVGMTWYQAAHYAEAANCRLISELEWEYAATNGGTTTYPWGDTPAAQQAWELRSVEAVTHDTTLETGVHNLFSNAAELTDSILAPYPGGEMSNETASRAAHGYVYRGGPASLTELDAEGRWSGQVNHRMSKLSRDETGTHLGFRCGRSVIPRFVKP